MVRPAGFEPATFGFGGRNPNSLNPFFQAAYMCSFRTCAPSPKISAFVRTSVLFLGKSGCGPWHDMETKTFLSEFVSHGCPVVPAGRWVTRALEKQCFANY